MALGNAKISTRKIVRAVEADDNLGFCTDCGEEAYGCEPDAEGYTCESCGAEAVYGAEQLLIMGFGTDEDDDDDEDDLAEYD
jgi:hypothetical protein